MKTLSSSLSLFTVYRINREFKSRLVNGEKIEELFISTVPIGKPILAASPESALSLAQKQYPLTPHRLCVGPTQKAH